MFLFFFFAANHNIRINDHVSEYTTPKRHVLRSRVHPQQRNSVDCKYICITQIHSQSCMKSIHVMQKRKKKYSYAPPSVKRGILSYPCPSVRPSVICYPQLLLNYPLDCRETWLDCSLGCEYVNLLFLLGDFFILGERFPSINNCHPA